MEHFCNSVSTICDIFRGEFNTLFCAAMEPPDVDPTDAVMQILPRLERIAHSYFERCTRAYRGIIIGSVQPQRSIDHVRRMLPSPSSGDSIAMVRRILEVAHIACNQNVFDATHAHVLQDNSERELAWHLLQTVQVHIAFPSRAYYMRVDADDKNNTYTRQVHRLPPCIAERQQQALERRYHGDTTCIDACSKLHLCIHCVVRKGTIQGIRLRHDCQSGELVCMHCGPGTVLTINMVGCIAAVAKDRLLLSSCCGCLIFYTGLGGEYTSKCGTHCASPRQLFSKRERTALSTTRAQPYHPTQNSCFVCTQRNGIQQTLRLLDPRQRCIVPYGLCAKHIVPQHISATIFDKEALMLYFRQQAASVAAEYKRHSSSASHGAARTAKAMMGKRRK